MVDPGYRSAGQVAEQAQVSWNSFVGGKLIHKKDSKPTATDMFKYFYTYSHSNLFDRAENGLESLVYYLFFCESGYIHLQFNSCV